MPQTSSLEILKCFTIAVLLLFPGLDIGGYSSEAAESKVPKLEPATYTFSPGPDFQFKFQSRLIQAIPGDVLVLEAGKYQLLSGLNLVTDNVTIRGQGHEKTVLSFKDQTDGSFGLLASGDNLVLEDFAVEDTSHNAIKVLGAENVTFRGVRTEWTGGPKTTNGAYGLYPVQCKNVLIENCIAIGAADAGIYVGQSTDVVVRNCRAESNVAGIEIENTINADVYENVVTKNTGGLLVFDLPGLPQKNGRHVRLFRNRIFKNNTPNFAPKGNMVASVPAGTGVLVMATDDVEVFENQIEDNRTFSISVVSFLIYGKKLKDKHYDPYPEGISIHDNQIKGGGTAPDGELGLVLKSMVGTPLPAIVYDGVIDPKKQVDGKLPTEQSLRMSNNGDAKFLNVDFSNLSPVNIATGKYRPSAEVTPYEGTLTPLKPVQLKPHGIPEPTKNTTLLVYYEAPQKLSELGLFQGNGASQEPVDGVIPYDLITTLFTDYTTKYRFVRLPEGGQVKFKSAGVLEFPVGAMLIKTFSYLNDLRDPSQGERLLETRVEFLKETGWYGYSYIWNEEQTEAELSLGGGEVEVSWVHSDGKPRSTRHLVPNANQCISCHGQHDKYVPIGPTAANLNRLYHYAQGEENQLAYLTRNDLLKAAPEPEAIEVLADFDDPDSGTLDQRVRAYLSVNCAHCHSPGGNARTTGLDLRLTQSDPAKIGVWKTPVAAGRGSGGRSYDIVPGEPDKSILMHRLQSRDLAARMPNIGNRMMHQEAVELIQRWIREMQQDSVKKQTP
ncbi:parallel beta-helix domain-containing protein [uncultured Gimesia sp.]|uniref:parallel beta-helix domain-containing protein n=1 Tax=uncultured Gimesia sp. TaxID=1678688 RepID=UPI0030DC7DD0|tara:strand:- start:67896 stop:70235 length:2340 start_codon:yes stop_codon:yes gene_type:complete